MEADAHAALLKLDVSVARRAVRLLRDVRAVETLKLLASKCTIFIYVFLSLFFFFFSCLQLNQWNQ